MLHTISMPLAFTALHWLFIIPISLLSVFLTLLILVQRGRGGGLTGALGGMGGQSAFGTKAGDVFTKITIVTAMLWILLSMGALRILHVSRFGADTSGDPAAKSDDGKKGDSKTDGKKTDGTGTTLPAEAPPATPIKPAPAPAPSAPPAPASTPGENK